MVERPNTSEPYVSAGHGDAWAAEAQARGQVGTQRLLWVVTTAPTDEVRDRLRLPIGEPVVARSRLIVGDGEPVEIATSFYPASFAAATPLAGHRKIKGGAVAVLAELGRTAVEVTEALTARRPTADEAATLRVDGDEALLVLTRISIDRDGVPVEFAVNVAVGRRAAPHTYRLRMSPP